MRAFGGRLRAACSLTPVARYRLGAAIAKRVPPRLADGAIALIARSVVSGRGRARIEALQRQIHQLTLHQQRLASAGPRPADAPHAPAASSAELNARVRSAFSSYCRYWFWSLRLIGADPAVVLRHIEIDGEAHADAAFAAGKGAICVMPHIGMWDLGGAWLASRYPLSVVAERLEPPELFDWFVEMRAANGMEVVPLGDPDAGQRLLARLRGGGFIGLLTDRDINHDGIEVTFFGARTTMSAGPATLALRTGAPILPTVVYERPGHSSLGVIRAPIAFERSGRLRDDVARLTQQIADELQALIAAAPEQWHVLQPNWPSDPGWSGAALPA